MPVFNFPSLGDSLPLGDSSWNYGNERLKIQAIATVPSLLNSRINYKD